MNRPSDVPYALPTWIPEGLIRAGEESMRRTAMQKKVDERRDKILSSIRVTPLTPSEELLEYCGVRSDAEKKRTFFGKNVLDVGGGFSWFAPLAIRYGALRATVADPIFFDPDPAARLSEDLEKIRTFMRDPKERLLTEAEMEAKLRGLIETNLAGYDRVYADASFWKGYSPDKFPSIRRLAAYAEDMSALPDGSQNLIFAANVLWKPTMDVEGFHKEILRLLAPGGKVLIIDCEDDAAEKNHEALEKLLSKTKKVRPFGHLWFRILEA